MKHQSIIEALRGSDQSMQDFLRDTDSDIDELYRQAIELKRRGKPSEAEKERDEVDKLKKERARLEKELDNLHGRLREGKKDKTRDRFERIELGG